MNSKDALRKNWLGQSFRSSWHRVSLYIGTQWLGWAGDIGIQENVFYCIDTGSCYIVLYYIVLYCIIKGDLDMISIVTKLPTWLFSVPLVLDLILIITATLHDWCFPSIQLPVAIYFHLLATIYLHCIPLLLLLLYYSITFLIPDYQNTNLS